MTFSVPDDTIRQAGEQLAGRPLVSIARGGRGGNNPLYRIECNDGQVYALKYYPLQSGDPRDRLGVEFNSLTFLTQHKIDNVPKPIAMNRAKNCALFEWIEGHIPTSIQTTDIDAVLGFMDELCRLSRLKEAHSLPPSSAACWSIAVAVKQLEERRIRLNDAVDSKAALLDFLRSDFDPTAKIIVNSIGQAYPKKDEDFVADLPYQKLTLSPSDFGFHNALQRADGGLVFIDFEYFGWDDPVKLVADFLHHPGMQLTKSQAGHFQAGALQLFKEDKTFAERLSLLFPLYGLCWCMILLNEFLPANWSRRQVAGVEEDRAIILARQLAKARKKLEAVKIAHNQTA